MSDFAPVHLAPERALHKRVSQTMLRHFNACRRSGFLYQATKGELQNADMVRGRAVHTILERATKLMIEQGEPVLPPELIKVVVNEVLAREPVPIEEHDYVRELSYRWALEWAIDPAAVIACETLFVLEIAGWQVRAKVDYAALRGGGLQVYVGDYKSGRGAPPYDEISRKRSDGSLAPRTFQLILYALALVYGRPVRFVEDECDTCGGNGIATNTDLPKAPCEQCGGAGHVTNEVIEPFAVAPRAQEVITEFVYPGIEDSEGRMLRRTMGLTRIELEEYRESLAAIIASLEHAEQSGDWPAVVSDLACNECPLPAACPIPAEVRDHRGEINSMDELVQACEVFYREGKVREAKRREIKATAKALGGPTARVRFGADRVWELAPVQEKTTISDKDALFDAVERAVNFGTPFDRDDYVRISKTTPFSERALTAAELEKEREQATIGGET